MNDPAANAAVRKAARELLRAAGALADAADAIARAAEASAEYAEAAHADDDGPTAATGSGTVDPKAGTGSAGL